MLVSLTSSRSEFKAVTFRHGLNLLVAQKSRDATDADSRNGSGKSSLVEVLHFMLGLNRLTESVLRKEELSDYSFTLLMEWAGYASGVAVSRSLAKRAQLTISPNVVRPGVAATSPGTAKNTEWIATLGRALFQLPEMHPGVSTRALIALYLRRDSQGGFNDAVTTYPRQSTTEATTNIAYLLGLDWNLIAGYQGIAARERFRRELKRATKDPVFGVVVGSTSELRGQIASVMRRVEQLEKEVESFNVLPEYEEIQQQADLLADAIRRSRIRDSADRRNLQDLEHSLAEDQEPDTEYIGRVYRQTGLTLPDAVVRTFEEVRAFHQSVASNRRSYLESELESVRRRLEERARDREALGLEQARLLDLLSSGGALDAYSELTVRLSTAQAQLDTLRGRLDTARRLEATQSEIKLERVSLRQRIAQDLDERSAQVNGINELFQRFAVALYGRDREAYIEIDPLDTSLRIRPHIGGEDSRGIGQMTMFCFDLTWAVIAHREGRGPDFLVHDSHLYDGVDERQVSRALQLAADVCEEEGLQYIVTMNSDDLAKTRPFGFDPSKFIIRPRLTDAYADGGLFGIRFM